MADARKKAAAQARAEALRERGAALGEIIQRQRAELESVNKHISDLQLKKLFVVIRETVEANTPNSDVSKHTAKRKVACRNDAQYSQALDREIARFREQLVSLRNAVAEAMKKGSAKASFAADCTSAWADASELAIETKEAEVERLKAELQTLCEAAVKHLANITRPVSDDQFVDVDTARC